MNTYRIEASARIAAPACLIYGIIADYRNGHPHILPPQFSNLVVEEGGIGAGTHIRFEMTLMGRKQAYRAIVSEPEPGRVLVEDNGPEAGSVSTFIVEPVAGEEQTQVTIVTEMKTRAGLAGAIERFLARMLLRRIYKQELALLTTVVKQRQLVENIAAAV